MSYFKPQISVQQNAKKPAFKSSETNSNHEDDVRMTFTITELIVVLQLTVGFSLQCQECRVCPSGYAYREHSVTASETDTQSGNCMNYPPGRSMTQPVSSELYINCTGTDLTLTDSIVGQSDYTKNEYYEWRERAQLLFIFRTRVTLTNITLHYYNDDTRGLPPLRFFAAPDHFNVLDAPDGTYVDVNTAPPRSVSEPAGSITFNFSNLTMKVLMVIPSTIATTFSLSEVEFHTLCPVKDSITTSLPLDVSHTAAITTSQEMVTAIGNVTPQHNVTRITNPSEDLGMDMQHNPGDSLTVPLVSAITVTIIALLVVLFILIVILYWYKQKHKQHAHKDSLETNVVKANEPYSTFQRAEKQPLESPYDASTLYDQIHLSPCTGQSEVVTESMHKIAESPMDVEYAECKGTENSTEALETENVLGSPVYAVVDIKKKKKTTQKSKETESNKDTSDEDQPTENQVSLEEMYAVVNKKAKKKKKEQEEPPPPIPEQTVEALYTAVQK